MIPSKRSYYVIRYSYVYLLKQMLDPAWVQQNKVIYFCDTKLPVFRRVRKIAENEY